MLIEAKEALKVWEVLEPQLRPHFQRLLLCGSLRRGQPRVNDIDLVGCPTVVHRKTDLLSEDTKATLPVLACLMTHADREAPDWVKPTQRWIPKNPVKDTDVGRKSLRFFFLGVQVDLYLATEREFWPQVVIRTGPQRPRGTYGPKDPGAEQNSALAMRAKRMGLRLKMGPGLYFLANKVYVGWKSERAFFKALDLPYCPFELRDHPNWIKLIQSRDSYSGYTWEAPETSL